MAAHVILFIQRIRYGYTYHKSNHNILLWDATRILTYKLNI